MSLSFAAVVTSCLTASEERGEAGGQASLERAVVCRTLVMSAASLFCMEDKDRGTAVLYSP